MDYYLVLYFLVGVLQDILFTLNVRFVAVRKALPASIFSFLVTVVNLFVIYNIITKLSAERGFMAIIIYALGIGTGTLLATKLKGFGLHGPEK